MATAGTLLVAGTALVVVGTVAEWHWAARRWLTIAPAAGVTRRADS